MEHITEILLNDYLDKKYRGILYEINNFLKYRDKIKSFSKYLARVPIKKKIFDNEFKYICYIVSEYEVYLCLNVKYMNSGRPKECICLNRFGDVVRIPIRKIRTFNNLVFKKIRVWDYEGKEVKVVDIDSIVAVNKNEKFSLSDRVYEKYEGLLDGSIAKDINTSK